MRVKIINPLPETLSLRNIQKDDEYHVEHISCNLEGNEQGNRKKGYLVSDRDGKPITLWAEEVTLLNDYI